MWNNMSLQTRVALMSGLSFLALSVLLAFALIYRAESMFSYEAFMDATGLEATTAQNEHIRVFFSETSTAYLVQSALIVAFFVLAGAFALWFLSRRMVLPISRLADVVEDIDADNLPEKIDLPYDNVEIVRLENAFNDMLFQIDTTMEGQKRFVENAAHELKTPIASMMTNLEVLEMEDDPDKEDYEEVFQTVKDSANRMHKLVKDLLTMTQLAQREHESFRFSDLTLITEEVEKMMHEKAIELDRQGDTTIEGSRPLMERALQNLVHNAIRYNHHGGTLRISADDERITISDTGPGIPPDKLKRIFEPFYCADPSRSRELGGSGLGLSIVKQILTQHGMDVRVASEEGKGTTFTVILNA